MRGSLLKEDYRSEGLRFGDGFGTYNPLNAVESRFSYDNKTSPLRLSFSCLCAGCRPPRFFEAFDYLEIGNDQSLGVLIHASCYPHGRFYLMDENPIHAANVREAARLMGLTNVEVVEATLESVVDRGLPKMDYVVTHGMVPRLQEEDEVSFAGMLAHLVKPGGLVVAGYESMPYWSIHRGIVHLMRLAFERSQGSLLERVDSALKFLEEGVESKIPLLVHSQVENFVKELRGLDRKNLATRFLLPSYWRPRYFSEVSQIMSEGKMSYLTSADLQRHLSSRGFPDAAREVLASFDDRLTNELLQDVLLNQNERWDIYGKGRIQATATDMGIFFEHMKLVPLRESGSYAHEVRLRMGNLAVPEDAYNDMHKLFAEGKTNFVELFQGTESKNHAMFLSRVEVSILLENAAVGFEDVSSVMEEACGCYNEALLKWSPDTDYYVASPKTGEGVKLSLFELHSLPFVDESDMGVLGDKVLGSVRSLGGDFRLNGEVVKDGKEFYAKAGDMFEGFRGNRRKFLERLGVKLWG
jgi:hypothetical protein